MPSEVVTWQEPAKIYPAPGASDEWIVEGPNRTSEPGGPDTPELSGHGSAALALRYAYERWGRARFFAF